jgi:cysteine desulfurase/selenocysteine lyase
LIFGTAKEKPPLSFNIEESSYDIGTIIDKLGIAVRTGHHCAQPIMTYYNIQAPFGLLFSFYNTKEEIDTLVETLKTQMMLS